MYIFEMQFKLKSQADEDEGIRLFKELAVPILRKIQGLISVDFYKYSKVGENPLEWDYVYVEVWESEEAHRKADKYIGVGNGSEMDKTGYFEKAFSIVEKFISSFATQIASIKE